jgi:apolipoprotein N-acyltransferase
MSTAIALVRRLTLPSSAPWRRLTTTAVVLSGCLLTLSSSAHGLWFLHYVAYLGLLVHQLRAGSTRRGLAAVGFPLVFLVTYGWWLVPAMRVFGELPMGMCVALFSALALVTSVPFVGLFLAPRWLRRQLGAAWPLAWAALFVVVEWAVDQVALFPVTLAGAQLPVAPVRQWVALGGTAAITGLVTFTNACLAEAVVGRDRRPIRVLMAAWVVVLSLGQARSLAVDAQVREADTHRVGLIQTDVRGEERDADPVAVEQYFWEQSARLAAEGVDLLVWPESASVGKPGRPEEPKGPARRFAKLSDAHDIDLVIGASSRHPTATEGAYTHYNSASLFVDGVFSDIHDKARPMPFAEYLPLADWLPAPIRTYGEAHTGIFSHGGAVSPLAGARSYGVAICYEAFSAAHVRQLAEADLLLVLSNDSWSGQTTAPHIAASFARLRALETGKTVVRSGLVGPSMLVTPDGAVRGAFGAYEAAATVMAAPVVTVWAPSRWAGEWFVLLSAGVLLVQFGSRRWWR